MKLQLQFLRMNKIYKAKKKITAALLILAMIVTGITVPDSCAQAYSLSYTPTPKPVHEYDVYIDFYCYDFNIRDTSGNILFEMVKGKVIQQDMERVEYISMSLEEKGGPFYIGGINYPVNDLYIRGCKYFIITCTWENSVDAYTTSRRNSYFTIRTSSGTSAPHTYRPRPNMEISVFGDEVSAETPSTKLRWDKVEEAEVYVVAEKSYIDGSIGSSFIVTKKNNCTVFAEKGNTYLIRAQKRLKGSWRNITCFAITISDDKVNTDSRPTAKLRWNKVKKAERYAVFENSSYWMSGMSVHYKGEIPFVYTKKTSCTIRCEEGKTYKILAQKKVKGRWKTIKYFNIEPPSYD